MADRFRLGSGVKMSSATRSSPAIVANVVAGVSVAMIAVPQALAYAELAGLPAKHGLYAAAIPSILAAFFASSPYLQTGPVALTALLTFGALSPLAEPFSAEYVALAALLALFVGLVRLALGFGRMGKVAYLLSEPVLIGFTTGAAVLIIASQAPKLVDVTTGGGGVVREAATALSDPANWAWSAVAFAVMTAVFVIGGRFLSPKFPGVLVAVVVAAIASAAATYGGSIVGTVDASLIEFTLERETFGDDAVRLLFPALAIALVGFTEPASIARRFAAEDREPWDADREMVGQGVANVAAGVFGGFPVGGSFSRSSLNRLAGANSRLAGAVSGATVLVAIPLVGLLEELPTAVLGAIVVVAVAKLIVPAAFIRLLRESPAQAFVAFGTLAAVLVASPRIELGVLVGVVLSIGVHLFRELQVTADSTIDGDRLDIRPKGVLWFATVPQIGRVIRTEVATHPELARIVIDLSGIGRLDYTGAAELARIVAELEVSGLDVTIVEVQPGAARAAAAHLTDSVSPSERLTSG